MYLKFHLILFQGWVGEVKKKAASPTLRTDRSRKESMEMNGRIVSCPLPNNFFFFFFLFSKKVNNSHHVGQTPISGFLLHCFSSSIVTHNRYTTCEDLFTGTDARRGFLGGVKEWGYLPQCLATLRHSAARSGLNKMRIAMRRSESEDEQNGKSIRRILVIQFFVTECVVEIEVNRMERLNFRFRLIG